MKNVIKLWVMVVAIGQIYAQKEASEIQSVILPVKQLITHAADAYPVEDPQKLIVLIETNTNGITTDERFYLEQGIELLRKRLNEGDKLAIFSYGASNEMLLPYSSENLEAQITTSIQKLNSSDHKSQGVDGIDLAYAYAQESMEEDVVSKLLMLRNEKTTTNKIAQVSKSQEMNGKETQVLNANQPKLGGAIAITALTLLPEILEIIKN